MKTYYYKIYKHILGVPPHLVLRTRAATNHPLHYRGIKILIREMLTLRDQSLTKSVVPSISCVRYLNFLGSL